MSFEVKGWCPGALRPMLSGDGYVVRVRPRLAELSAAQALGLCAAAEEYGAGLIDLTNRANLQVRGVQPAALTDLLAALTDLGLVDADVATETRRNILTAPTWAEGGDTHRLTGELLARLEAALPGQVTLITQNVDDLHQRAGSGHVIQMHGALMSALCAGCRHRWPAPPVMALTDRCPACGQARTRPDVVWFGEIPYHMEAIAEAVETCTHFAAIGTSGQVYPAAGLAAEARRNGAQCTELNLEPSEISRVFQHRRYGPASEVVPAWVDSLLD